jgi:hypothetical protein
MPFITDSPAPLPFDRAGILGLPPGLEGVYGIFNYFPPMPVWGPFGLVSLAPSWRWLYIGTSEDVRGRLLDHLNGHGASLIGLVRTASSFCVVERRSGIEAYLRESELIREYQPLCNLRQSDPGQGGLGTLLQLLALT